MLEDCVPLTTETIQGLVEIGWAAKKLQEVAKHGGLYCAPRDSIIFPDPKGLEMVRDGEDFLIHQHDLLLTR